MSIKTPPLISQDRTPQEMILAEARNHLDPNGPTQEEKQPSGELSGEGQ